MKKERLEIVNAWKVIEAKQACFDGSKFVATGAERMVFEDDYLYRWVKESEYILADTYGIEHYQESHEDGTEVMDLMFPVKKKTI